MRIVVAMSGGVDSSVAALSLVEEGHEVIGFSMQLYDQQQGERKFGGCCSLEDLYEAKQTAAELGIKHYIVNYEQHFNKTVVSNFVSEYSTGRTPIPCVRCNGDLKFSHLLDRATALGADYVATGHYARIKREPGSNQTTLHRGRDLNKDQSYFLFSLNQKQLARALFPVGHLLKEEVRDRARVRGLGVADKPDSQELCFVTEGSTADFVERHSPTVAPPGPIRDLRGEMLGRHEGLHRYTVGQRKGLGLSTSTPLYILELNTDQNTVTVGPRTALERTTLTASEVNWTIATPSESTKSVTARIRHRHPDAPASVEQLPGNRVSVVFNEPQLAIAPGQAVVFYEEDQVIGGGWID